MASHSDDLLNQLLQKMLSNIDNVKREKASKNDNDSDSENGLTDIDDDSETMLVFKDLKGQVWQISKVSDDRTLDFSQLTDDTMEDINLFKHQSTLMDKYKDYIRKSGVEQIKETANQYYKHCS